MVDILLKRQRLLWVGLVILMLGGGYCSSSFTRGDDPIAKDKYFSIFFEAYNTVKNRYIEKVDPRLLYYGALKGMFRVLDDPYSNFLDDSEFNLLSTSLKGSFGGIGFSFRVIDEKLTISYIFPNSPAKKAGLRPRDVIVKVNGKAIKGLPLQETVNRLRGKSNSKVRLSIKRPNVRKLINKVIIRKVIKPIIVEHRLLEDNIGYIRFRSFSNNSSPLVRKALLALKARGIKGIIFDLRSNLGGDLVECIRITNFFLDGEKKVLSMKEKKSRYATHLYSDDSLTILPKTPLVVLVNGSSASASEIFLGAIQDHKRGIAIGSKTYGKGSIQSYMASRVKPTVGYKITHSKWFTPNNRAIDKKGLKPDIIIETPKLTIDEQYYLIKLYKSKLIPPYILTHPSLSEADIDKFMEIVKARGINLKRSLVKRFLKKEKYDGIYETVIDMDFDRELKSAWSYLTKKYEDHLIKW